MDLNIILHSYEGLYDSWQLQKVICEEKMNVSAKLKKIWYYCETNMEQQMYQLNQVFRLR